MFGRSLCACWGLGPDGTDTGALSIVRTEDTDNQSDRGELWGTVYCMYRGHWQPVGERVGGREHTKWSTLGQYQLYIQRALATSQTGPTGVLSTVHTEGTGNQSDRGHTVGHCQLYIQRAQTTSQTGGTHSGAHWGSQTYGNRTVTVR